LPLLVAVPLRVSVYLLVSLLVMPF